VYDFAVPALLPTHEELKSHYARPITDAADRDATPSQQVCCSVLQGDAVCCSALHTDAADCDATPSQQVCRSVL